MKKHLFILSLVCGLFQMTQAQIRYVKSTATGTEDGSSWSNASSNLQAMIDADGVQQVWVAAGTYKPTSGTDRTLYFTMKNGVAIYGGFPNTGNPGFNNRNWNVYSTILSGDIGTPDNNEDNSYHVIFNFFNNLDHTALLDGIIITRGSANVFGNDHTSHGGGVYNQDSSPAFNNCFFIENQAMFFGGGMYNKNSSPLINNCTFSENSVGLAGGGIFNENDHSIITNSHFNNNSAVTNGGGIHNNNNSAATISHCTFIENTGRGGGGLSTDNNSTAMISNCIFKGNFANERGGGVYNYISSSPTITNCLFIGNAANDYGGGMHNDFASSTTINCSFSGNTAGDGGGGIGNVGNSGSILTNCIIWGNNSGIYTNADNSPVVNYSIVQGGYSGDGTGNLNEDPLFVDQPAVGLGTSGDLHLLNCSPAINTGTEAGVPATDLDGNARPFNGGFDMGTYEFQGVPEPPVAGCKNIPVYLNEFGEVSVPAADLNFGSTGCGTLVFTIDAQAQKLFTCLDQGPNFVTLTVTDASGLSTDCNAVITVIDDEAPVVDCSDINSVQNAAPGQCSYTPQHNNFNPPIADNCGATRLNNYNNSSSLNGAAFPVGITPVVWTATDAAGNTASCTVNITIIDNEPPTVTCFDQTLIFNGEEQIELNADDLVDANDNCGIANIALSPAVITCAQLGSVVTVTATITDEGGNTIICTSQITVAGLPCGWSQDPDGAGCEDGSSITYNPATQVFTATSTNCYYAPPFTSDELAFAQFNLCGNSSITAQVTGITGLGWAGVTLRENNAAGAKKVQLTTNMNSNQSRREVRYTTNGDAIPQQFMAQGRFWLRLVRQGNQVIGYTSANGVQWFQSMAVTVSMNACIEAGLVLSNFLQTSTVTATFANLSITGESSSLAGAGGEVARVVRANNYLPQPTPHPDFSIFPNPTNGEVTVDLSAYVNTPVRLELYDLQGKVLKVDVAETATQPLDLSTYQNGIYLIRVQSDGVPDATKRVVVNSGN